MATIFDVVVRHAAWVAHLGAGAYSAVLAVNTGFNRIRRRLGLPYWSLSAWTKLKVKNAVNYIGDFEQALANEARRVGADGVVCGHIHHARIEEAGASATSMPATGWRAARRSSSTTTAASRSSAGPRCG